MGNGTVFDVVCDRRIEQQKKHPDRIEAIEEKRRKLNTRLRSGLIPIFDMPEAKLQLEREIDRICAPTVSYPKSSSGNKSIDNRGIIVPHQAAKNVQIRKSKNKKSIAPKRLFKKGN